MEKWKSLDRCNVLDETEKDDNCRIYKDELIDNLSDSIDLSKFCDKLVQRYNVDLSHLPWETQYSYLRGKSLYVLPESQLKQQLVDSKVKWKPLVVKFWIDPTWSDIHLWHTVPIIMLNRLQRMWHNISFVIWDFTAGIWDPTWRSKERPTMTDDQINEIKKAVNDDPVNYGYNVWDGPSLSDFIKSQYNVDYGVRASQKLFHKMGFSLIRPQTYPSLEKPDDEAREDFKKNSSK